jgi:hypothetical protein
MLVVLYLDYMFIDICVSYRTAISSGLPLSGIRIEGELNSIIRVPFITCRVFEMERV